MFNPLDKDSISLILDKIIKDIELRLKDSNIKIKITDEARKNLINDGYDITYGARPLKRLISRIIETNLSKMIIRDQVKYGDIITIDYQNSDYIFSKKDFK